MRTNRIAAAATALALTLTAGCGGDKDTKNTAASDAYNKRMSGTNPEDRRGKDGGADPGKDAKDEKKDEKK